MLTSLGQKNRKAKSNKRKIWGNEVVDLTILSTISSNLISNVPAVLLLRTMIHSYSNIQIGWLVMAMATTFAGNLTVLGSVANLIVAETSKKFGVRLYFKGIRSKIDGDECHPRPDVSGL